MKNEKVFILSNDKYYKKGVEKYLSFNTSLKDAVTVINDFKDLSEQNGGILITDKELKKGEIHDNIKIFELVDYPSNYENKLYKFTNFEELISRFRGEDKMSEKTKYKIVTVSSTSKKSGKTLIANTVAEILNVNEITAYLNPISVEYDNANGLSELILTNEEGGNIRNSIIQEENGIYKIPGFKLLRDYMELDKTELIKLFEKIRESIFVKFFVIEIPDFFSKTAEELIRMSETHIIVSDCSQGDFSRELQLLKEYSLSSYKTVILKNFVQIPQDGNELPSMRKSLNDEINNTRGFLESDFLFFKYRLAENLGVMNA